MLGEDGRQHQVRQRRRVAAAAGRRRPCARAPRRRAPALAASLIRSSVVRRGACRRRQAGRERVKANAGYDGSRSIPHAESLQATTPSPPASPANRPRRAAAAAGRGQQEAERPRSAQPVRQLGQVPDLAQVHAELEQAMLVQRQRGAVAGCVRRRVRLDRIVVGDQRRQAAVGDPLAAALRRGRRAPRRRRSSVVQRRACCSSPAAAAEKPVCRHTMSPVLDRHLVGFEDAHQLVVAHRDALAADVGVQVDHHAAALHAASPPCSRCPAALRRGGGPWAGTLADGAGVRRVGRARRCRCRAR